MLQAHLQGGYGPYGGGQGMPAMPQQHMGYQKGFMQPQQQQQRMEVTVPVPEARVEILPALPCQTAHPLIPAK